jgi:ABC-type sugar transport system permease subunit
LSFHNWGAGIDQTFVGLEHFNTAATNEVFHVAVWHGVIILAINLFSHTVLSLGVAVALQKTHSKLQSIFQTALLLPMSMMAVAVALVWTLLYNPELGIINTTLEFFGLPWQPNWIGDTNLALYSVIFVNNWWWFGFWVVIWLVGLSSIDDKYYEAAAMDGANRLRIFWHVTLPQLKQTTILVVTLTTINALRQFGLFWVMTQGGPGHSTEVLLTWIYKVAFDFSNFGRAAALTVFTFIIIMLFTVLNFKVTGTGGEAQ